MDPINLVIPQFHSVARSFTQKVNLKNYVQGHDYEMVDFFSSHSEQIPLEEATKDKIKEISEKLYQLSKQEVEQAVADFISDLRKVSGVTTDLSAAELAPIAQIVAAIENAKSKTALNTAKDMATAVKGTLGKGQLEFLAALFRKAEAKL